MGPKGTVHSVEIGASRKRYKTCRAVPARLSSWSESETTPGNWNCNWICFSFQAVGLTRREGRRPEGAPEIKADLHVLHLLLLLAADSASEVWHLGGIARDHFQAFFRIHGVTMKRNTGAEVLRNAVVPEVFLFTTVIGV